jgi:hypothetical protein
LLLASLTSRAQHCLAQMLFPYSIESISVNFF